MENLFKDFDKKINEPIKFHTTFHIGGNAKCMVFPKTIFELKRMIKICNRNNLKYFILGNGSNVLFDDNVFDGVIISTKKLNKISIQKVNKNNVIVRVESGVNLYVLNKFCLENKLYGLEWSYGIPASFGGFIFMNGGCFEHEICENILSVTILENNKIITKNRDEIDFSYRHSKINGVILYADILLKKECFLFSLFCENVDKIELRKQKLLKCYKKLLKKQSFFKIFNSFSIKYLQTKYFNLKKEKQPLEYFSAGSIYKRGNDFYPAKIIDELGFKGVSINDAEISTKHAGFIVNKKNATFDDVICLMKMIENKAKSLGYVFEREIIIVKNDEY